MTAAFSALMGIDPVAISMLVAACAIATASRPAPAAGTPAIHDPRFDPAQPASSPIDTPKPLALVSRPIRRWWIDEPSLHHSLSDDCSTFDDVAGEFDHMSEHNLTLLNDALTRADAPGVRRAAHAIKTGLLGICAGDLALTAQAIEYAGRDGRLQGVRGAVAELSVGLRDVRLQLDHIGETRGASVR